MTAPQYYISPTNKIHAQQCRHFKADTDGWQKMDSYSDALATGAKPCKICCPKTSPINIDELENKADLSAREVNQTTTENKQETTSNPPPKPEETLDNSDTITPKQQDLFAQLVSTDKQPLSSELTKEDGKTQEQPESSELTKKESKTEEQPLSSPPTKEDGKTEEQSKSSTEDENKTETKPESSELTKEDGKTGEQSESPVKEDGKTGEQSESSSKEDDKTEEQLESSAKEGDKTSEQSESFTKEDDKTSEVKDKKTKSKKKKKDKKPPAKKYKILAGNGCHQAISEVQGILVPPIDAESSHQLILPDGLALEATFSNPYLESLALKQPNILGAHWFRGYPKMQDNKLVALQIVGWDGNMPTNEQGWEKWEFIGVWTIQKNLTVQRSMGDKDVKEQAIKTGYIKKFKFTFSNSEDWLKRKKLWIGYVYQLICRREGDTFKIQKVIPYACPRFKPVAKPKKKTLNKDKSGEQSPPKLKDKSSEQISPKSNDKSSEQISSKSNDKSSEQISPKSKDKSGEQILPKSVDLKEVKKEEIAPTAEILNPIDSQHQTTDTPSPKTESQTQTPNAPNSIDSPNPTADTPNPTVDTPTEEKKGD
ncbi:hypothetical protein A5482_014645 (plasmid) [Cyanobacterium sp. IPPAS B-1200]|uniref:hypothetical protein n=1 Tax=Cyanobacterium sp. IPPAS B-1200 TaxID=1562720 RepID=UPI003D53255F